VTFCLAKLSNRVSRPFRRKQKTSKTKTALFAIVIWDVKTGTQANLVFLSLLALNSSTVHVELISGLFCISSPAIVNHSTKMNSFLLNSACNYTQPPPGPHTSGPLFGYGLPDPYGQLPAGVSAVSNSSAHPVNVPIVPNSQAYGGYSPNTATHHHPMYTYTHQPSDTHLSTNGTLQPQSHCGSNSMPDLPSNPSNCNGNVPTSSASATVAAAAAAAAAAAYEQLHTNYSPQLSQSPGNNNQMHNGLNIESDFYTNTVRSMHNAASMAATVAASGTSQNALPQASHANLLNGAPQSITTNLSTSDQFAFHRHLPYATSNGSFNGHIHPSLSSHNNSGHNNASGHNNIAAAAAAAAAAHHSSLAHQGQAGPLSALPNSLSSSAISHHSTEKSSPNTLSSLPIASSLPIVSSGDSTLSSLNTQAHSSGHHHHPHLLSNVHLPNSHLHAMQQMNAPHSAALANNRNFNAQSPMTTMSSHPLSQLTGMTGSLSESSSHLSHPLTQMHNAMFQNGLVGANSGLLGNSFGQQSQQNAGSRCSSSNASSGNANSTNGNHIKVESPHSPNSSTNGSCNGISGPNALRATNNGASTASQQHSLNRSQNATFMNGQSNGSSNNGGKPVIYPWMKKVQLNTGNY
jgi:hypothetical protein